MITTKLESFLRSWHKTSGETQRRNGKDFQLSFDEFLALWSPRNLRKIQKWCDDGNLYMKMDALSDDAFVLTWTSYAEAQGAAMHSGNAQICKRSESLKACRVSKGDKLTTKTKKKISATLTGKSKPDQHRAKIATSMLGVHVGRIGTEEESKRKSDAAKARWDRVRAEIAAAKGAEQ